MLYRYNSAVDKIVDPLSTYLASFMLPSPSTAYKINPQSEEGLQK